MSNMKDELDCEATMTHAAITEAAMRSIEDDKIRDNARSYAMVAAISSYGEAARGDGVFGRISKAAMWFCVWFAMIVPVLLFWDVKF